MLPSSRENLLLLLEEKQVKKRLFQGFNHCENWCLSGSLIFLPCNPLGSQLKALGCLSGLFPLAGPGFQSFMGLPYGPVHFSVLQMTLLIQQMPERKKLHQRLGSLWAPFCLGYQPHKFSLSYTSQRFQTDVPASSRLSSCSKRRMVPNKLIGHCWKWNSYTVI